MSKVLVSRTYNVEIDAADIYVVSQKEFNLIGMLDAATRCADMGDHKGWLYCYETDDGTYTWIDEQIEGKSSFAVAYEAVEGQVTVL